VAALAAAAHASTSRLRVVLGIRADFYGRCAEHPDLVAALRAGQILVGGMNAEQLRAAITQPALRTGLVVETGLVATIVSEMVGRPGALPLMSHVLVETWRRRRGATLSLAGYQAAGELRGALAHTAERAYAALDAEQQRAARELFLRLIALRDGGEDTRRRLPRGELAPTDQTTTAVVDNLARARLLSVTADGIEIAHEALIRAWPRLAEWLAADRDGLRVHRQLTEAARTWDCLDRDPGALYRGLRLANAQDWDARRRTELTPTEREFLAASGAAAVNEHLTDRARSWLMWFLVATVMIMYGGLVVVGVVALRHR
jgi:hypothetical protein